MVTRQGWFLLDSKKCGSMILSSVQVDDLWWLSRDYFFLSLRNMDRWSYHPSKSMTCDGAPTQMSPWLIDIKYRWFYHPSKSLTCGDAPWVISYWLLEMWMDDSIICPSRWLVLTRQVKFLFDYLVGIMDRWSYHSSNPLTCGDVPRVISPWL